MSKEKNKSSKSLPDLDRRLAIVIRGLRKCKRLTQEKLADRAGVTQEYISFLENAQKHPKRTRVNSGLKTLQRVAIALDRSLGELVRSIENVPGPDVVVAELDELIEEFEG